MEIATELAVAIAGAATAIGGGLTAAIAALWVENKSLTKRYLDREDGRETKREAIRTQRDVRRELETAEFGVPRTPQLDHDDRSDVYDVAWHEDKAVIRTRLQSGTLPPPRDPARDVLAGELQRYTSDMASTPPEPPFRTKLPSRRG